MLYAVFGYSKIHIFQNESQKWSAWTLNRKSNHMDKQKSHITQKYQLNFSSKGLFNSMWWKKIRIIDEWIWVIKIVSKQFHLFYFFGIFSLPFNWPVRNKKKIFVCGYFFWWFDATAYPLKNETIAFKAIQFKIETKWFITTTYKCRFHSKYSFPMNSTPSRSELFLLFCFGFFSPFHNIIDSTGNVNMNMVLSSFSSVLIGFNFSVRNNRHQLSNHQSNQIRNKHLEA